MKQEAAHRARIALVTVSLLGLVPAAYGATLYAANNVYGVVAKGVGKTVSKNQVWQNEIGVLATAGSVVGKAPEGLK